MNVSYSAMAAFRCKFVCQFGIVKPYTFNLLTGLPDTEWLINPQAPNTGDSFLQGRDGVNEP